MGTKSLYPNAKSVAIVLALSNVALADRSDAIVVVVESHAQAISGDDVRDGLADTGLQPLSLLEPRAAHILETLTIVVQADGRSATVHLRTPRGVEVRFLRASVARAPLSRWLLSPIAALVRTHRAVRRVQSEVVDPWGNAVARPSVQGQRAPQTEVLDPWGPRSPRPALVADREPRPSVAAEVLDPWAHERSGAHPDSALINPWSAERGSALTPPTPHD